MTHTPDYIPVDKLRKLTESYPPPLDNPDEKRTVRGYLDHVGQLAGLSYPDHLLEDDHEENINQAHYKKILSHFDSVEDFNEIACRLVESASGDLLKSPSSAPNISCDEFRLVFSFFHYLLNEDNPTPKYYRGVVERAFELLDLGPVMGEEELLSKTEQIKALTKSRGSHEKM
jgi:hypothetical protein